MIVYHSLGAVPPDFGPCALTIGNFDGVHFGHRRILRRLCAIARDRGWKPSALTFDPHPTRIVAPERTPLLMTSPDRRAELMREEGIQQVLILPFTTEIAHLSPEDFVRQVVAGRLQARAVLVGSNFRFGYRHSGDVDSLAELGRRLGFETEIVPATSCRGRVVSSSDIRSLTASGRVSLVARLLQRPYSVEGDVVSGRGVGSRETVPTLNLATSAQLLPASGVYVTRTADLRSDRSWNSVTNIGYRPTFGASSELSIETFLLEGPLERAPERIRVEFLWRLRDERRFPDAASLRYQILRDVSAAVAYFRRVRAWTGQPSGFMPT
jgi:riboflavin kinase / FMN adenylyltransferase